MDPPVPGMTAASNWSISGFAAADIRRAVSVNNGSSYLIFTNRRNESVNNTITPSYTGYTFNPIPIPATQNITPKPDQFVDFEGKFELTANARIFATKSIEAITVAESLAKKLRAVTGFALPVVTSGTATSDDINVKLVAQTANLPAAFNYGLATANFATVGAKGYRINVDIVEGVVISAYTGDGLLNGALSVLQLLPAQGKWLIPYCNVVDTGKNTAGASETAVAVDGGTVSAGFILANDSGGSAADLVYLLAVYNNGRLVSLAEGNAAVESWAVKTLSAPISDGQTAKAFIWNKGTLVPVCEAAVFE